MGTVIQSGYNIIKLELAGSLDKRSAPQVRQAIFHAVSGQPLQVIINMRGVNSVDASGLSALVSGLRYAQENRVQLCLCDLQSPVRMIFELTRFDKVFDIFVSEEDDSMAVAE